MDLLSPLHIALALLILNLWTFMAFGWDKICAEERRWRVSEDGLLSLALIGGTLGAYTGRAIFRHETRKQPFSQNLHRIAILQSFALSIAAGWFLA